MERKVLIVEDEPDIRELLELTLANMGYKANVAANLKQAFKLLDQDLYFLCLTDMRLPDGDGIELVEKIQQEKSDLPVAVITAFGNVEGAVNTLKAGAFDYVSKPISLSMLKKLVSTAVTMSAESSELSNPTEEMVGNSSTISKLKTDISKLARSQAPVFIHGESGVGKELVANLIHKQGPRSDGPFIPVNCGAIPSELMESEFFGHKKGSFTGALQDHKGLFQAAQGGTLFLDEIAELPLHMQVKLLRAIQEKAIKPIGCHTEINVDVRILSATHKNLQEEIHQDRFRQDLYYRINVIELSVPSLRERLEDIPELVYFLLRRFLPDMNNLPVITDEAIAALKAYPFPGNVRELENILERALTLCDGNHITPSDLQLPDNIHTPAVKLQTDVVAPDAQTPPDDLNNFIDNQQREVILKALEETKWNRTAAAKLLGITFRALRYRLKKLGIE
jgi:two-component system response regulator PilR (NtrC family)